jgi:flagellar motor switch protein FliG
MAQRAAVVLTQLDDERAQRVLAAMSELEVISIMAEVSKLPIVRPDDVDQIVGEFLDEAEALLKVRQGGTDLAQRWLRDRLGLNRASEVMVELQSIVHDHPLTFLNRIEPQQIVGFLGDEHPQTVALVLANLHVEHAARVLEELEEEQRIEIARRVATMGPVPAEVVKKIANELESRLSAFVRQGRASADIGGVSSVVALLNSADRAAERQILSGLEQTDPELADRIRNEMFVFDDVMALDDATLQVALRSVVMKDMALALKGKPPQMVEKITRNISERAAEDLLEDMASLGPQRLSVVEAAEAAVVKAVRGLADAGEITIGRGNDELVG